MRLNCVRGRRTGASALSGSGCCIARLTQRARPRISWNRNVVRANLLSRWFYPQYLLNMGAERNKCCAASFFGWVGLEPFQFGWGNPNPKRF